MTDIEQRKKGHISVSLNEEVEGKITTGFENVKLIHKSLPEINLNEVDISTSFLEKDLETPLIISAITGGTNEAKTINERLARVAEEFGMGIGVGSQRIAIEQPETVESFSIVRKVAPKTFVMGNLGCPQIALGWGREKALRCIEMIDADALAIHMNPLQEAVQVNGETNYRGIIEKIQQLTEEIKTPIIMKETGCGIAYEVAMELEKAGVAGIEISGSGGTSWAAIEHYIARGRGIKEKESLGLAFWDWGIPTAISVVETSESTNLRIIASGGIRSGIDIAKAIVLGADTVGIARPFLVRAIEGEDALKEYINRLLKELKVVMYLVGAKNIKALKDTSALIMGETAEYLQLRGFRPEAYSEAR